MIRRLWITLLLAALLQPTWAEEGNASGRSDDTATTTSDSTPEQPTTEPTPATAAKIAPAQPTIKAPRPAIQAAVKSVLDGADFNNKKTIYDWRYIGEKAKQNDDPGWLGRLMRRLGDLLQPIGQGVAGVGEALLWFLALALLVVLAVTWRRWFHLFERFRPPQRRAPPTTLFGLDVRPESLPDRPADAALRLWREGRHRAALSLLYRATLARLIQAHHLDVPDGATEGDCLHLVNRGTSVDIAGLFADLTSVWLPAAYGERWPDEPQVAALCSRWNQLFENQLFENQLSKNQSSEAAT